MAPTPTGTPADEGRHPPTADAAWHEGWTFDFWDLTAGVGGGVGLVLWPGAARAWYWATLVRAGQPALHLADLDVAMPRVGLEIRAEGLWAAHACEVPFEQWTVANEAYAVALDDPDDALGRAHGTAAAIAFDLEWYAGAAAVPIAAPASSGYRQTGLVNGVIELTGGRLALEAPSGRIHWWGTDWPFPWVAAVPAGARAPVRLALADGPAALERVLTPSGWWEGLRRL